MKNIVIAVDYYPTAQKVAEIGAAFATALSAKIVLVHVLDDPLYYSNSSFDSVMGYVGYKNLDSSDKQIVDQLRSESMQYLENIKLHLAIDNVDLIVGEGDVAPAILEIATNKNAEMIIIGTHSKNWLENILLGSAAETVLHESKIPILIIPIK